MTGLNTREALNQQIKNTLTKLEMNNGRFSGKSTDVEISPNHLAVILRGVMSNAERLYAHSQSSRAFLQTLYARQLTFIQQAIKSDINLILNKKISGMNLTLEPESGDVILTLPLSDI